MSHKLDIRAFFFNAKTDYLPYYKNFSITIDGEATAEELLKKIQEQNENFSYPKQKLVFKINNLVVDAGQSIGSIVEKLGTSLQIDPVSSYRSNNGLKINDQDFMQNYTLLEPFTTEVDLEYYKTLYALHYASETENFRREYIGDAILVLAHKMIMEGSEHKEAILKAITSVHSGLLDCEYENNLFNQEDHTATIAELKAMVKLPKTPSFMEKLTARFSKKEPRQPLAKISKKVKTINNLEEKQIAYYAGLSTNKVNSIHQMIIDIGAKVITFERAIKLAGFAILEDNKDLALTKAGTVMLDAFDRGAEILIIEDEKVLSMFEKYFTAIERTIGREIDLELLSTEDFVAQATKVTA